MEEDCCIINVERDSDLVGAESTTKARVRTNNKANYINAWNNVR